MLQDKPSRRLWIVAIVVAGVCVAGLAYALVSDWNTEPARPLESIQRHATGGGGGSGFSLGLLIGIGGGIVLGTLIALRGRR